MATANETDKDFFSRKTDKNFLNWLAARLVNRYNESPNTDFVLRLQAIANDTDPNQTTKF